MTENIKSNVVKNHGEATTVENWISQINAGGQVYDIATHHGITFKDGNTDSTGVTWNGLTDLEVVIPNIIDIVQTPIEFAGTVGAGGAISWNTGHGNDPQTGNLVFITADCTFNGIACEAGDMAIYDGSKWNVVSGENQVEILGNFTDNKSTLSIGDGTDVLTVEGKTLALALNYADINTHVSTKTGGGPVYAEFNDTFVESKYIKLQKEDDTTKTIGTEKKIDVPTALASGAVTFDNNLESVVTNVTFGTFNAGAFPTSNLNEKEETFVVTGGSLTLTSNQENGDFVDNVAVNTSDFFVTASAQDAHKITMIESITATSGDNKFFSGITEITDMSSADLIIKGGIIPTEGSSVEFIKGFEGGATTVVTDITEGTFTLTSGSVLATGFGDEGEVGEVVSSVTINAPANTEVLNSATVSNHILSFGTVDVVTSVAPVCKYKSLNKTGFTYTPTTGTTKNILQSGFTSVSDVYYKFDRTNETIYEQTTAMWKIGENPLNVTKGKYDFSDADMITTVPSQTFVTGLTSGTLPSLSDGSFTPVSLAGHVSTVLSTTPDIFNVLNSNTINVTGAYSITTGTSEDGVSIEVGAAGQLDLEATVDLGTYITSVEIK